MALAPSLKAQIDTVFWFAAPWVTAAHAQKVPVVLRISTFGNPTSVRIKQVASTYDTTINIGANSLFSKDLSHIISTLETLPANTVVDYGLRITSDFPVTIVYEIVSSGNNPETYSLKGQNGMGKEFVTPFQTKWNNGDTWTPQAISTICIVASENNTTVWVTPRCAVVGHPAGVTYSVTLNAGQSYNCQNVSATTSVSGQNLSGTIVVSSKPISVTVSDDSVWEVNAGGCRDVMGDQIVPTDVIGKEYIVNKGKMYDGTVAGGNASRNSEEGVFIVATQNFTSISVTDSFTTSKMLNQGETWYYNITDSLAYIVADKPVYVLHASGFGCELGEAILPPLNCSGSGQVSFSRTNNRTFILNLLCRNGAQGAFTLNGSTTLVPASAFRTVPGTSSIWVGAQIDFSIDSIPVGTTQLLNNSTDNFSMGVINGNATGGALYHYMSSFIRRVHTNAGADNVYCSGLNPINLNGSVSGGATTGIWSVLNGTGTLNNTNTSLINSYTPSSNDTAQGSVTLVLASTGNCIPVTDTVVFTFKPNPRVSAGTDVIRCDNNLGTINISGTFANAAGVNWTTVNGTGSITNPGSNNTTYSPSPGDLANDSVTMVLTTAGAFFGCPNVTDTLKLYFQNAPLVNAGSNATVCANNAVINLSGLVNGGTTNGLWTTNGSGVFTPNDTTLIGSTYSPSNTDTTQGIVIIKLTSLNNGLCNAVSDSITITIVDAPTVDITTNDTLCGNIPTINLISNVTSGFPVDWNTSGAGSFVNQAAANTTYNISPIDTAAGQVDLILTTVPGLCNSVTDTLHLVLAEPPYAFAGLDQAFCSNEVINLSGVVSGVTNVGAWTSTGTGTFTPDPFQLQATYIPSLLDVGTTIDLILTSTNNQGCNPAQDVLQVTFKPIPIADFSATEVCLFDATNFTDLSIPPAGSTISSWAWTFGDLGASIAQNPIHTYSGSGSFTVTMVAQASNGCSNTVTKTINVNIVPIAEFTNGVVCQGNATQFNNQSIITTGNIVSWQYNFGDQTPNSNLQDPTHIFIGTGFYPVTLVVTSDKGCTSTIAHNINVLPKPDAFFSFSSNPGLAGENITFNDVSTGGPVSWYWDFGDSTAANTQNPGHIYEAGGYYDVTLTVADANGCTDSSKRELLIALLPVLPTAFTPNGDNENDIFLVRGGPFNNILFKVYNNWGELLFTTTDQKQGWDGKFKDVEQPMSVYVWYVEVEVADGRIFKKSGDVTLIR